MTEICRNLDLLLISRFVTGQETEGQAESLVRLIADPTATALGGSYLWTALKVVPSNAASEPTYVSVGSYWNFTPGTRRVDAFTVLISVTITAMTMILFRTGTGMALDPRGGLGGPPSLRCQ